MTYLEYAEVVSGIMLWCSVSILLLVLVIALLRWLVKDITRGRGKKDGNGQ